MIANNLAHGTKQQKKNWKTKNKTNVIRRNSNGTLVRVHGFCMGKDLR